LLGQREEESVIILKHYKLWHLYKNKQKEKKMEKLDI
jgi:hypothetical protein